MLYILSLFSFNPDNFKTNNAHNQLLEKTFDNLLIDQDLSLSTAETITFNNCWFSTNTLNGFSNAITFYKCTFDSIPSSKLVIQSCTVTFNECYFRNIDGISAEKAGFVGCYFEDSTSQVIFQAKDVSFESCTFYNMFINITATNDFSATELRITIPDKTKASSDAVIVSSSLTCSMSNVLIYDTFSNSNALICKDVSSVKFNNLTIYQWDGTNTNVPVVLVQTSKDVLIDVPNISFFGISTEKTNTIEIACEKAVTVAQTSSNKVKMFFFNHKIQIYDFTKNGQLFQENSIYSGTELTAIPSESISSQAIGTAPTDTLSTPTPVPSTPTSVPATPTPEPPTPVPATPAPETDTPTSVPDLPTSNPTNESDSPTPTDPSSSTDDSRLTTVQIVFIVIACIVLLVGIIAGIIIFVFRCRGNGMGSSAIDNQVDPNGGYNPKPSHTITYF